MKVKQPDKLFAGFAVALALLSGVAWFGWRHITRMQEAAALVAHTERMNDELDRLLMLIERVQSDQRGYLLTGKPALLKVFEDSLKSVEEQKRLLAQRIDDGEQKANLSTLAPLLAERIAFARRNVDLRQNAGFEAAVQELLTLKGKNLTDQIGDQITRIDARARALLDQRAAQAGREANITRWLTVIGTGLSFALLIIVFALVLRENRLRQRAEARLRDLFDGTSDIIQSVAPDGHILFVNRAWHETLGYSKDDLAALIIFDIIHPDYRERCGGLFQRLMAGEDVGMFEMVFRAKDGHAVAVEGRVTVHFENGRPVATRGIFRDVTGRKEAEEQVIQLNTELRARASQLETANQKLESFSSSVLQDLRESEERLRQLAEHINEVFWMTDVAKNQMVYISPAYETVWGRTCASLVASPRNWLDAIHPEDRERIFQAAFTNQPTGTYDEEYRIVRPDGKIRWIHDRGYPVRNQTGEIYRIAGVAQDITERKLTESHLLRTQRLESIGTLAGGVAHDLNNALAPILMATELLRLEFPDTATNYLEMIQASAKRGADMVKQLLTFAKGAEGERLLVQPRHLLKEMEKLIRSTFPKNLQLQTSYEKDLRTILGDATQLHQVLLNLCVNARDAMPEGGTLTLKAENMEIDTVYARTVPEAKPGSYVVWRVTDTGTGIPPEILEHIFEPFFTTKGPEKGTGLGLSTVIGLVKSHGGFVQVYSTPGQGTTFAVYLPAYGSDAGNTALLTKTDTTFRGHGETILVVDDEAAVRNILRAVLTKLNFKVLTAGDGAAALIQVAEQQKKLRAVITDLHMPHMDGLSFVRVFKGRLPQAGIIVVSGRVDQPAADELKELGVHAVLEKPFTQEKLVEALKNLLAPQ